MQGSLCKVLYNQFYTCKLQVLVSKRLRGEIAQLIIVICCHLHVLIISLLHEHIESSYRHLMYRVLQMWWTLIKACVLPLVEMPLLVRAVVHPLPSSQSPDTLHSIFSIYIDPNVTRKESSPSSVWENFHWSFLASVNSGWSATMTGVWPGLR